MGAEEDAPAADAAAAAVRDREALERLAFARPDSETDAAAAAAALRQLVAADRVVEAAHASEVHDVDGGVVAPVERPVESADEAAGPSADHTDTSSAYATASASEIPRRRRRSLVPIVAIAGLVIGLGGGYAAARTSPQLLAASGTSPSASTQSGPQVGPGNSVAALAKLASPQTSADKFPLSGLEISLGIVPGSMHNILTLNDGLTLWIARASSDICLIYTFPDSSGAATGNAGTACATIEAFTHRGLTLDSGRETWTWNGTSFTTTPDKHPTGMSSFPPS